MGFTALNDTGKAGQQASRYSGPKLTGRTGTYSSKRRQTHTFYGKDCGQPICSRHVDDGARVSSANEAVTNCSSGIVPRLVFQSHTTPPLSSPSSISAMPVTFNPVSMAIMACAASCSAVCRSQLREYGLIQLLRKEIDIILQLPLTASPSASQQFVLALLDACHGLFLPSSGRRL